jgi:UDP:flavonoid glycosyltransferase YjiC (YdhE family)
MGAGLGHLDRLGLIGRELRRRGHEVVFVLRDLHHAQRRLGVEGFRIAQAPIRLPRPISSPFLGNYASVLAAAGWLDADGLTGLLSGWRTCFDLLQPDLVVADHAPTAVLAARGEGVPVCVVGNSFQVPPSTEHFPPMMYWAAGETARCPSYDAAILPVANRALALMGKPPLGRLTDLFADTRRVILSLPELAHYRGYGEHEVEMLGPSFAGESGEQPRWPAGGGPRVFGYIEPRHPEFASLIRALQRLDWPALLYGRGLRPDETARISGRRLRVEPLALRVNQTIADADIVITQASIGTASAAALAGKPQLALPGQAEQWMVGRRLADTGAGVTVDLGSQGNDLVAMLNGLAQDPSYRRSAQALAAQHVGATPAQSGIRVADLIENMLDDLHAK